MPTPSRPTARVLLFDPDNRLLLMQGRLPGASAPPAWFTIGGGVEPGEALRAAAAREILEETGFTDAILGPQVWYGEVMLADIHGAPLLFKDHYFVARCSGGEPSRAGWQDLERTFIDDLRWWDLADFAACADPVFPAGLAALAVEIAAGVYPSRPRILSRI